MIDKELLNLLGNKRSLIFIIALLDVIVLFANLAITVGICISLYNIHSENWQILSYVLPIFLVITGIVMRFVMLLISGKIKTHLALFVKKDLRGRLYDKILRLSQNVTNIESNTGLVQLGAEGIEQLDTYYAIYLPQFFYAMSAPIILFIITAFIELKTALVLLVCVPLIPISIIFVSKFAKRIFNKYWNKYISMGGEFLDALGGMRDLKIFEADERQSQKINTSAEEFRKVTMKVLTMQLLSIMLMDLVAFGGAGIGITVAVNSGVSGELLPFYLLFIILIAAEFFLPLRSFGSAFHMGMNGATAGRKILNILSAVEPNWGVEHLECINELRFHNLSFNYDNNRNILNNVTMFFPKKHFIGIVGKSGSGKSTIVKLITGECRTNVGDVLINGQKLSDFTQKSYYSRIALVNANTFIFNDTLRNNFRVYKQDVTDVEIIDALAKMRLLDFINENGGIDKTINEDGENLSGGQKQRLALACALVNATNKDIFIFDEATSNIDIESETIIMNVIYELANLATVILISHRLENVVKANNIYVLQDSQIVESGTHSELLHIKGQYAKLYQTQKELEQGFLKG